MEQVNIVVSKDHQLRVAMHLLLALFTCGLWLPIAGIIEIVRYIIRRR